jgi:hypothetical protein
MELYGSWNTIGTAALYASLFRRPRRRLSGRPSNQISPRVGW